MSYIVPSPLIYQELVNSGGVLNSTPDLEACIIGPAYNVVKYVAGSTIAQTKTYSGAYTSGSSMVAPLSSTKPGQLVEDSSVNVWLNSAVVEKVSGSASVDTLSTRLSLSGSGSSSFTTLGRLFIGGVMIVSDSPIPAEFSVGDSVVVPGGGEGGVDLTTTITGIYNSMSPYSISISPAIASNLGDGIVIHKASVPYLNPVTNTPNIASGDSVVITWGSPANTFVSQVSTFNTSGGNISGVTLTDITPATIGFYTTGSITSGSSSLTVTSATGMSTGDTVVIVGAGAGGSDLVSTLSAISGTTVTLSGPAGTTVSLAAVKKRVNVSVSLRKVYYDQPLTATSTISSNVNFSTSGVASTGSVTVNPVVELPYGKVLSANVHIGYRALRQDLLDRILTINDATDLVAQLEDVSEDNPLGLGVEVALANTVTRIRAISIGSNDLTGYLAALELAEAERLYALVPLTQDLSIISAFKAHVVQMSTPENAAWRIALVSIPVETTRFIGVANNIAPNNNASNAIGTVSGLSNVLTSSTATFISDKVTAGDTVVIMSASDASLVGTATVSQVLSNQQLRLTYNSAKTASSVVFYIRRAYSKTEQAANLKAAAQTLNSSRVINMVPDTVGVSVGGVTKYLPGYYLACGTAGMVAGFPVQQGFTNIGIAGITDLRKSNYYFTKANLNTIAEGGNFIYVQDTQGGTPYCRHELTTDVSVLEYRELLLVKDIDYLSYHYYDKLKPFIGTWNITDSSINSIRQTLIAASELMKSKKLPKIGAPLVSYTIDKLEQSSTNKDTLVVVLSIVPIYPLNYVQLTLAI